MPNTIEAIQCDDCKTLMPADADHLEVVLKAHEVQNRHSRTLKVSEEDLVFCSASCLTHYIKTHIDDEIPF